MNGNTLPRLRAPQRMLASLLALCFITLLSACGGGSSGSNNDAQTTSPATQDSGEVIIGLTDAEGDFHSYTVDVLSINLIRANGAVVETLPLSTRVDFAQYTELTEFLTAATVPAGIYTGASLLVDYSNAEIVVEDAFGNGVQADAVDSNGKPLGQLELQVDFENSDTLRIAPGLPVHMTLDFDLAASNRVDLSVSPALVSVEPILIADTILEDPKPHRLRGVLNQVAVDENIFSLFIRPFYHRNGNFGSLRVHGTDDTAYEIDRQTYSGHDGIVVLAELEPRAPVVVLGQLERDSRRFVASDVVAGTSVPWGDVDMAVGNVLARAGNALILSHVSHHPGANQIRHQQLLTVLLGADTTVTQQGPNAAGLDINAISIGQRLLIAGDFTDDLTLDASQGRVRLQYTHLSGNVTNTLPLAMDLQAIDRRRVSLFDFSGTGTVEDTDPDNYQIDTGSLSLDALMLNEPVRVIGHVRPFGTAPADFTAQTVIALGNLPAKLLLNWEDGTAPFLSQSDREIVIARNPNHFGDLHTLFQGSIVTDVLAFNQDPTLAANESGRGIFVLAYQGRSRLYLRFDRFSQALMEVLDGANQLKALHARGSFDASTATLTVRKIIVRVQ